MLVLLESADKGSLALSIGVTVICLIIIITSAIYMAHREEDPDPLIGKLIHDPELNLLRLNGQNLAPLPARKTHIQKLIASIEGQWRKHIQADKLTFTVFCDPRLTDPLALDSQALSHIINSLMGRAVYTTASGRIHLHITKKPSLEAGGDPILEIITADTGSGVIAAKAHSLDGEDYDFNINNLQTNLETLSARLVHKSRLGCGAEFILCCPLVHNEMTAEHYLMPPPPHQMKPVKIEPCYAGDGEILRAELEALQNRRSQQNINGSLASAQQGFGAPINLAPKTAKRIMETLDQLNVLIAVNTEANRNAIRAMLAPLNSQIIYAQNGQDAVESLKTHRFDYIIMDIHMPGMSGIETAQIIRTNEAEQCRIPIIGLSSDITAPIKQSALQAGIDIILTKPVTAAALFQAIYISREAHPNYKNQVMANRSKRRA